MTPENTDQNDVSVCTIAQIVRETHDIHTVFLEASAELHAARLRPD